MSTVSLVATTVGDVYVAGQPEASHRRAGSIRVPGSQVRGVFAKRWIGEHGSPQDAIRDQRAELVGEFVELFHGSVRWPSLQPDGLIVEAMSALVHKGGKPRECTSTTIDLAYHDAPQQLHCECCVTLELGRGDRLSTESNAMVSRTRVGLEQVGSRREQARESMLYTRQGFAGNRNLELVGTIASDGPLPAWLTELIGADFRARIGGQRSVDGEVSIGLTSGPDPVSPQPTSDGRIVLRATSPAVLIDDCGRPAFDPRLADLGPISDSYHIAARWVRTEPIGGWDAVAGLPRSEDIAMAAGSTWMLKPIECRPPADQDQLAALAESLRTGIGLRRDVGYGEVVINPAPYQEPVQARSGSLSAAAATGPVTAAFCGLKRTLGYLKTDQVRWLARHIADAAHTEARNEQSGLGEGTTYKHLHVEVRRCVVADGDSGAEQTLIQQLSSQDKKLLADVIEAEAIRLAVTREGDRK